jgi:hypothetical protein
MTRFSLLLLSLVLVQACAPEPEGSAAAAGGQGQPSAVDTEEVSLSAGQIELLDLAFESASAFPLEPHLKNRSRAQEQVALANVALGRLEVATRQAQDIANWRRGLVYAKVAAARARRGAGETVDALLEQALGVVRELEEAKDQIWRRDRVLATVAEARLAEGEVEAASSMAAGLDASALGALEAERVRLLDGEQARAYLDSVDAVLESGTFDQVRGVLLALAELYAASGADAALLEAIEERVGGGGGKIARGVQLEVLQAFGEAALAHGDKDKALQFAQQAWELYGQVDWPPGNRVPLMAHLGALRARSGDEAGLSSLRAAELTYAQELALIVDIDRADVLRAVARAWHDLGQGDEVQRVLLQALEAGATNPNARPRCDDLVATCLLVAELGIEPSTELLTRARALRAGLVDPW